MNYFDCYQTNLPIVKAQGGTKLAGLIGTGVNKTIDFLTGVPIRRKITNAVNEYVVNNTDSDAARYAANAFGILNSGLYDIVQSRINNGINKIIPGWVPEKAQDQVGKGEPVWTIDKGSRIARYYDKDGNMVLSSPAGIGMVSGPKEKSGDNKTPTGTFRLSAREAGANKSGGTAAFGEHFYRTNHKNDGSSQLSGVGLHGTGTAFLNGTNISHGCVRVDNDVICDFYEKAPNHGAGTKIIMYDKQGGKL